MRRFPLALVFVTGLVLGAGAWETLENLQISTLSWGPAPEPRTRAHGTAYTVVSIGAAVEKEEPHAVAVRAWAPAPKITVLPRDGSVVDVTVANVPRRARLVAPPGVTERPGPGGRVVSGPGDRRWEFRYADPGDAFTFAVLGDTGASATFEHALRTAEALDLDFLMVVGDLTYHDSEVARLRALLRRPGLPVYLVRGNHDYATRARREFVGSLAPPFYAFAWGGAGFVVVDNGAELLPGLGAWSDQHEWLTRTLAGPLGAPVFAFMHKSPLRDEGERPWHAMWDRSYARRLARDFERSAVRMVFAGHRHAHGVQEQRGVLYVTSGEGRLPPSQHPVMAVLQVRSADAELRFVPIWPGRDP
jgi:predicted phosphodiesterase